MTNGIPTVTALYGSLNALLNIALATGVSRQRGKKDPEALQTWIRIHGNNAEYVPLAIVLLLLAEMCGGASVWLHVAGGVLFVSRLLHATGGLRSGRNAPRAIGISLTWGMMIAVAIWTLLLRRAA